MSAKSGRSAYVALLRAVNVGGRNRLPMSDLVAMFEEAGCREVRTYIASGNVVYSATRACAERVPRAVARAIKERFGFESPVIVRTGAEMAAAAREHPHADGAAAEKLLHVMFLEGTPAPERIRALDPRRSPGDEFEVRGREVYVRYAQGAGETKLTNTCLEKALGTAGTMRNWRTVRKLAEMAAL